MHFQQSVKGKIDQFAINFTKSRRFRTFLGFSMSLLILYNKFKPNLICKVLKTQVHPAG